MRGIKFRVSVPVLAAVAVCLPAAWAITPRVLELNVPQLSPIDEYRNSLLMNAMRGLRYENGAVTVDSAAALKIASAPDARQAQTAADLGRTLLEHGEFYDAIAALTKAVILAPDNAGYYEALGDALTFRGKIPETAAAYRTALSLDGSRVETRAKLAGVYQALGEFDASIATWQQVIGAQPSNIEAHTRIAILYYFQHNYAASWAHVHAVERLGGNVPPQFRPLLAGEMAEPN